MNDASTMKILALEFSASRRSVAVTVEGRTFPAVERHEPRATFTATMVEEALRTASLQRQDLDCIAIGLGPGSYAGIRAAIAFAQGWAVGRPVELRGVATTDCLAAQAQSLGWFGTIHVVIDAQRQELTLATFEIDPATITMTSPPRIVSQDDARQAVAAKGAIIGPEVTRWFSEGRIVWPDAVQLAILAARQGGPSSLEPLYLRETTFLKSPPPRVIPGLA